MALTNSARDANSGTSDAETVYMYMSHFFDLPSMCADPTAYYPDWITNSDRAAYNNYISASNNTALIANVGQMSLSAKSLVDAPIAGFQKIVRGEAGDRLIGLAQVGDKVLAAKSLIEARVALGSLAEEGKTPQQIVDQVRTNLSSTWTDWNSAGVIIGTLAALMTPGVGAAVFGLGAVAVSMQLTGITTLFQTAAYNALRYTTSSRASGRFMRSLGW